MTVVVFELTDGRRVVFTQEAWQSLLEHRQTGPDACESGGVLLGRHLLESHNLVVDEVTFPQPEDRRSRHRFFRSLAHQRIARQRWQESGETVAYLGLWHTHPEQNPSPSATDLKDWKKALRGDSYAGNTLLFVIVGLEQIGVWAGQRQGVWRQSTNKLKQRKAAVFNG